MHILLLSGGSGKRLWPLSNEIRSKQFLKVLPDGQGQKQSMVQRIFGQIQQLPGLQSVTIAASSSQKDQIQAQLSGPFHLVLEPERRNTYPAIALACAYLRDQVGLGEEETVVVMPIDSYVEQDFFDRIHQIDEILNTTQTDIVLLGAVPTEPLEQFGYIVPEKKEGQHLKVLRFSEKPSVTKAMTLIEEGALWNCGVFGFKLHTLLMLLENEFPGQVTYPYLYEHYQELEATSFDYKVVEKAVRVRVIPHHGRWSDMGTWDALAKEIEEVFTGRVNLDESSKDTQVINELNIPVVVMGLSQCMVVATYDGILVTHKDKASQLKAVMGSSPARPMFEEKRWGHYQVMDQSVLSDGTFCITKKLTIEAGKKISHQYHQKRKEIWTILDGEALLLLDGAKSQVQSGSTVIIEPYQKHCLQAITRVSMVEVQLGKELTEDDIVRLDEE